MFKLKSKLGEKLKAKAQQVAQLSKLKASIHLPDDMAWWYYHENGTFRSYPIYPAVGNGIRIPPSPDHPFGLIVPYVGAPYTAEHPPIQALHYIRNAMPDIIDYVKAEVSSTFVESSFNVEAAHTALLEVVMPEVVQTIASAMDDALDKWRSDPRPDSKLDGVPPGEAYLKAATIVDKSE